MRKNMGSADRVIRILLAGLFAYLYFSGIVTGSVGIILLVLGGVFLATSFIGSCPLYSVVGINTCGRKTT